MHRIRAVHDPAGRFLRRTRRPGKNRAGAVAFASAVGRVHCSTLRKAFVKRGHDELLSFNPDYALEN